MSSDSDTRSVTSHDKIDHYDASYSHFNQTLYTDIRRETFDEDIGQNSWLTAAEQDKCITLLSLCPKQRLLDIACGSGGPTLRITERTEVIVHGIDIHEDGIAAANKQTRERGLEDRATFEVIDAIKPLPFSDNSFDAVMCIDAINHLPDRHKVLAEWSRILKPGGSLLFTDPIVVTGPLTNEEIAIRSSIGFFLFVSPDTDDRILKASGLNIKVKEDVTDNMADIAERWRAARAKHEADLRQVEGDETYEGQQRFFAVASRIARERRLSRYMYVAGK